MHSEADYFAQFSGEDSAEEKPRYKPPSRLWKSEEERRKGLAKWAAQQKLDQQFLSEMDLIKELSDKENYPIVLKWRDWDRLCRIAPKELRLVEIGDLTEKPSTGGYYKDTQIIVVRD